MWKEVCGVNGETYSSPCLAQCEEQAVACDGACPCQPARVVSPPKPCYCQRMLKYVCGENNQTFTNPCLAKCSNQSLACNGKCPCNMEAPVDPIEGNVGEAPVHQYLFLQHLWNLLNLGRNMKILDWNFMH